MTDLKFEVFAIILWKDYMALILDFSHGCELE